MSSIDSSAIRHELVRIMVQKSKGLKPPFLKYNSPKVKSKRANRCKTDVDDKVEISAGVLIITASGMYDSRRM